MSVPTLPTGTLPPNYEQVLHWRVTQSIWRVIILNILALPLGLIIGAAFFIFLFQFGRPPIVKFYNSNQFLLFALLSTAMVLFVHEWVHGIAMQSYGARPAMHSAVINTW